MATTDGGGADGKCMYLFCVCIHIKKRKKIQVNKFNSNLS